MPNNEADAMRELAGVYMEQAYHWDGPDDGTRESLMSAAAECIALATQLEAQK